MPVLPPVSMTVAVATSTAAWAVLAGMVGLGLGSFATRIVHRWPRSCALVGPPSRCASCGSTLRARDLVPVLSWLARRGRCRACRSPIGARPLVLEIACAAAAALPIAVLGPTWRGLGAAILALALVPVVAIDLEHRLIPDLVVLPATAAALAVGAAANPRDWWVPIASAGGAGGFMLGLWLLHPGGMGLGDVKLAALLGAALGAGVVAALALAFALGAAAGVVLIARQGLAARRLAVPFGPFLAAGALLALWWEPDVGSWLGSVGAGP